LEGRNGEGSTAATDQVFKQCGSFLGHIHDVAYCLFHIQFVKVVDELGDVMWEEKVNAFDGSKPKG
jgi:hypothetical protein